MEERTASWSSWPHAIRRERPGRGTTACAILASDFGAVALVIGGYSARLADPGDEVIAAYEAPFPVPESQGWRGLMMSVPHRGDKSAAAAADAFCDALRRDPRPILFLWAESDTFLTLASGQRLATRIGRNIDHVIPQAGHALPEDQGQMISKLIVDWLDGCD